MCVGAVLGPARVGLAAVATMPKLNIAPTCEIEGRKEMALGNSSIEACKRSELEARRALSKKWSHYEGGDRMTCMGRISHGGHPSYVELQSCLNRSGMRARYVRPRAEATRRRTPSRGSEILRRRRRSDRLAAGGWRPALWRTISAHLLAHHMVNGRAVA